MAPLPVLVCGVRFDYFGIARAVARCVETNSCAHERAGSVVSYIAHRETWGKSPETPIAGQS